MQDMRTREPALGQRGDPPPGRAIPLAAPPKRAPPEVRDIMTERAQSGRVGRNGVVVEPAGDDLSQPLALLVESNRASAATTLP